MNTTNNHFAFITGVSTGIGHALTLKLLHDGFNVIGSVRKEEDAEFLKSQLGDRFYPIIMDIRKAKDIKNAVNYTQKLCGNDGLYTVINNAGVALGGPMKYVELDKIKDQFEINVFGVISLTQGLLPLLEMNSPNGRIINISSVSGLMTTAFLGPYCSSKYALESISDAMRIEFSLFGVKLILIEPGPIDTPIWEKSKKAANDYLDTEYGPYITQLDNHLNKIIANALPMNRLIRVFSKALYHSNPRRRYLVVKKPIIFKLMVKFMPSRWMDRFQSRLINLKA